MKLHKKILIFIILIIFAIPFLSPLYGIIALSFKSMKELTYNYWGFPQTLNWDNFIYVWSRPTLGLKFYFFNSFKITIPTIISVIIISLFAAYPLAKFRIKGSKIFMAIIIFGITVPHQILIIPIFKMINWMHLYDTIWALILVNIAYGLPFSTFLLRNYMVQIPKEMIDAAMVDGCSHPRIVFNILFPICKPAITVIAILEFTWVFNEFFYGLILTNSINASPATVAVAFLSSTNFTAYWNYQAAAAIIISLPTLIVFLIFQRYFIKGIMLGSVKG